MKTNNLTKTIFRFILIFGGGLVLGALAGVIFGYIHISGFLNNILGQIADFFIYQSDKLFIGFTVFYLALSFILFFIGRSQVKKDLREDKDVINDNLISISLGIANIGYFISLVLFVISVASGIRIDSGQDNFFLVFIVIIASIFLYFIHQSMTLNFIKSYNPEKEGNVLDFDFNKKWLESSDEREKYEIYKTSYRAYKNTQMACLVIIVISTFFTYYTSVGIFTMLTSLIIYIVGMITYIYNAIKENKA